MKRKIFKAFKILIVVFLICCIGIFIYVSVNKKDIIAQVTSDIEAKMNGNLTVEKFELSFLRNFPAISVLLNNVSLTDTAFNTHQHTFFKAKEVFVSLSINKLIRKKSALKGLRIDGGEIYLFTDTTGYTNAYLLSGKKDSLNKKISKTSASDLKKITLNDTRITINDLKRGKFHNFLINSLKVDVDDENLMTTFESKANIMVESLAFNTDRGSFIKNQTFSGHFTMAFDKKNKVLNFDSINVKIGGQPFNLSGNFQLAGASPQFGLRIHSKKIPYAFVRSLVPSKISTSLGIVDVKNPLNVSANINGPLKGGEPRVFATWQVKNTQMLTPFLDFDDASFSGFYTNEVVVGMPRKDPNSKIQLTNLTAQWHGMPVRSNSIDINNLTTPELICDLSSDFELTKLNELIGSNSLKLQTGTGQVRLNYKGPIERNNNTNSYLNGNISFKNGNLLYAPRDVEMKNVNCKIVFRNSDVFVENLQTNVAGQNITMQGEAKNLLTLINTEPAKANIDWTASSPSLNLEAFTFLFASRKKTIHQNKSQGINSAANKIDDLLERGRLRLVLKAGSLHYKNFHANNALADITLLQDRYVINNVTMDHAGGNMQLNGSLVNSANNHQAKLLVNMNNVDVSKVLKAFDNFGQDAILAENLEGKLTSKIDASMLIDSKGKVQPSTLTSIVDFSLKDGALNNYEPLKKLQRFVFKNRNFDNIRFAELKDRLEIRNREIKINRMEIQSTVISLFVEGVYSQTGGTDMSIQVPLSNLKKRSADFNPENVGVNNSKGSNIFIRGRPGPDGNVKFKLDLFNRYEKQKTK